MSYDEVRTKLDHKKEASIQTDGKSLYEILQENKAKQEEEYQKQYAEHNALHRLDEHEVEYLEELETRKKKDDMEKKTELQQGLNRFREKKLALETSKKSQTPSGSTVKWSKLKKKKKIVSAKPKPV